MTPEPVPDAVWASVRSADHYPKPIPRPRPPLDEPPDEDGWLKTTGPYEIRLEEPR